MPLRYVTFEQIVELSNEGIWVLDEQARVVYVNRRADEIAGVSVGELMGQPVGRFVVPDGRGRLEQGLAALARGESVRVEAPVQLADGRRIWCQLSGSPVRSPR